MQPATTKKRPASEKKAPAGGKKAKLNAEPSTSEEATAAGLGDDAGNGEDKTTDEPEPKPESSVSKQKLSLIEVGDALPAGLVLKNEKD